MAQAHADEQTVILGDTHDPAKPLGGPTLDDLFRIALDRHGDAIALTDPPDRASFTDGAPRRLSWDEADRAISAVATRLTGLGLQADSVVAIQLPNIVEGVVTLLGVLRAGMIAVPLPLLWRQRDMAEALERVSARAIVTCRRVGPADHAELAMHVAAETFSVRFLGAFGGSDLDGFVPLDDIFDDSRSDMPAVSRIGDSASHVAVVTFDVASDAASPGLIPVARNHDELVAGGIAVAVEAKVGRDAAILGTLMTSSFAGIATTLVPWLMSGGTLALHQPFDPVVFARQCTEGSAVAVLPGPLVERLAETGLIGQNRPKTIVAVWRAPERLAAAEPWSGRSGLVDVMSFGEIGLTARRRAAGGRPSAIALGPVTVPDDKTGIPAILDVGRSAVGTLALGGAMVPRHAFPPAAGGNGPRLTVGADGRADTGYACRVDRAGMVTIDAPPAGTVSVGGYRFLLKDLQDYISHLAEGSTLAALPDALAGQRLAGVSADRNAIREALAAQGVTPLVVAAFRDRRIDKASAA